MTVCGTCNGQKAIRALVNRGKAGCFWENIACYNCKGMGEEPLVNEEWVRVGKALRKHRVDSGWGQMELAKHIKIDVVALSKMEQGKVDPLPYFEAVHDPMTGWRELQVLP